MIEVEFLLVERGEVGADGAEGGCAVESAEATGDLLFDFAHTDRLFGDVIGERGIGVERKAEHIVLVQAQACQQIRCVALPCSAGSELRDRLSHLGRERAAQFSWQAVASETLRVLAKAAGSEAT